MDWPVLIAAIASLPSVIDKIYEKLIDFCFSHVQFELSLLLGVDDELNKLKRTVERIDALLTDAEERRHIEDDGVKLWLRSLKDVAFDAGDLLDEVETYILLSRLPSSIRKRKRAWYDIFAIHSSFSDNLLVFKRSVAKQIVAIKERYDEIAKSREELRLTMGEGRRRDRGREPPPTVNFQNTPQVLGRDEDIDELVNLLVGGMAARGTRLPDVISIVGIGGLGKTTLVQHVFNDQRVVDHFLRIWVCVTNGFDVIRITREIIESLTNKRCGFLSLDLLQCQLREKFAGKRFLLVLDNVGDDGALYWEAFKVSLIVGGEGSKVLITTRSAEVSRKMGTTRSFPLKGLSESDCRLLFEQRACLPDGWDKHPNLKDMRDDIIGKCQGLPLAAISLGGLLHSVTEEEEWKSVLDELWELQLTEKDILPTLKLSYQRLPLHLKKCLVYCAVFPNGYEFEKDELVKLWMAEDLIQQRGGRVMEIMGGKYFDDLLWRSFFQTAEGNQNRKLKYKLPNLIHDLLLAISKHECSRLVHNKPQNWSENARYSSLFHPNVDSLEFKKFYECKKLRTFLLRGEFRVRIKQVPEDFCRKLRFLRVLDLSNSELMELPDSVGNLKHLRYLCLYNTRIETLPESVSSLCNLQTLELGECYRLRELPTGTSNLVNLRHLSLHLDQYQGVDLLSMPPGLGKLTSLRTLSRYAVGTEIGSGIGELKELNIRGEIRISKLENAENVEDVRNANLKSKSGIHSLMLQWSNGTVEHEDQGDIMESLRPHSLLKHLWIDNYSGASFPLWMGDPSFSSLLTLRLTYCKSCKSLPSLRQLTQLKYLFIEGLHGLKTLDHTNFPKLELFSLRDMPDLQTWSGMGVEMPCLNELNISHCPNIREVPDLLPGVTRLVIKNCEELDSLPILPTLQDLVLERCNGTVFNCMANFTSLTSLTISQIPRLKSVCGSFFQSLTALQRMEIRGCKKLVSLAESEGLRGLTSLESLEISSCPKLASCSGGGLPLALTEFRLRYCYELKSLPKGLHELKSLRYMEIRDIPRLTSLPEHGVSSALQYLAISGCPLLKLRCERDDGTDWPKIQHIPLIEIEFQQIPQN